MVLKQSNLDSFLNCTTPIVESQFLPKSETRTLHSLWHPWEREMLEYFTLGDLWNCYHELSAYGAGVPVVLGNGETLVQYYVPYLSAIQIFTSSSALISLREEVESVEGEMRDSLSDWCSEDSGSEKLWRWDGCSSEDEWSSEQDCICNVDDRLGHLYFHFFERSTPYGRVPLVDKISSFARRYPGLMSLRSVDLSPASWMSVAWYPIYSIPMGRTIKDLSACFLTYHTLSSSFQDMGLDDDLEGAEVKRNNGVGIALPPFGMATYKMQGDLWLSGDSCQEYEKLVSLLSVADSWLKQLNVQHHDFNYFMGVRHG